MRYVNAYTCVATGGAAPVELFLGFKRGARDIELQCIGVPIPRAPRKLHHGLPCTAPVALYTPCMLQKVSGTWIPDNHAQQP